ncbi:porin [Paraburkholderia aromaticivorans]|uniref:porin n=1 Tax=Paraburkholderia aromaticivorans TaxID=2026199 RepID=UPI001455E478
MSSIQSRIKVIGAMLAVSAALPVFAQSSVTLYGVVDDAITYVNNQLGHSNVYLRQGNLYSSRFGFRGSEDLGGGLAAIFDLQEGFDPNSGAQSSSGLAFNRQAFVGLQDRQFGTLTFGRQYTPYYQFVGPLGPVAYLTGATGAHPGDLDGLDTTIRANSSAVYTSPTFYGFRISGMYGFGGVPGSWQSGSTISAAGRYDAGPLAVGVGYLLMHNTGATGGLSPNASASYGVSAINSGYVSASSVQHIAAAANYTLGSMLFGLNYSNVQFHPGNNSLFTDTAVFNTYGAVVRYAVGQVFDVAGGYSYTRASSANGIDDPAKYHQVSLKEAYHLSKRTTVYALQVWQHASGRTLAAAGAGIIDARPAVGDLENATPSSTANQIAVLLGLAVSF